MNSRGPFGSFRNVANLGVIPKTVVVPVTSSSNGSSTQEEDVEEDESEGTKKKVALATTSGSNTSSPSSEVDVEKASSKKSKSPPVNKKINIKRQDLDDFEKRRWRNMEHYILQRMFAYNPMVDGYNWISWLPALQSLRASLETWNWHDALDTFKTELFSNLKTWGVFFARLFSS